MRLAPALEEMRTAALLGLSAVSHQAVSDVWVHGRHVVRRRRLATADQDRLLARVRELTRDGRRA